MKLYSLAIPFALAALSTFTVLSEEPFQYKYEIVANSNSPQDIMNLYHYKEKLIDIYESYFMTDDKTVLETRLINNVDVFKFDNEVRARYAYGTIVVLVGNAKGMCLAGNLKTDSCDETVIRTKIFIFDLFF